MVEFVFLFVVSFLISCYCRLIDAISTSSLFSYGIIQYDEGSDRQARSILRRSYGACGLLGAESMIKCMGKHIAFVWFMPNKPIKHGIKVYALCFSRSGVLCNFKVYTVTGKSGTTVGTPNGLIDDELAILTSSTRDWLGHSQRKNPLHYAVIVCLMLLILVKKPLIEYI